MQPNSVRLIVAIGLVVLCTSEAVLGVNSVQTKRVAIIVASEDWTIYAYGDSVRNDGTIAWQEAAYKHPTLPFFKSKGEYYLRNERRLQQLIFYLRRRWAANGSLLSITQLEVDSSRDRTFYLIFQVGQGE